MSKPQFWFLVGLLMQIQSNTESNSFVALCIGIAGSAIMGYSLYRMWSDPKGK